MKIHIDLEIDDDDVRNIIRRFFNEIDFLSNTVGKK